MTSHKIPGKADLIWRSRNLVVPFEHSLMLIFSGFSMQFLNLSNYLRKGEVLLFQNGLGSELKPRHKQTSSKLKIIGLV